MVQADHHSLNGPLDVHPFATLPAGEITVKPRNRLTARQCGQWALQISTDASSLSRVPARPIGKNRIDTGPHRAATLKRFGREGISKGSAQE